MARADEVVENASQEARDAYVDCFSLAYFLSRGVAGADFDVPRGLADAVALTAAGERVLPIAKDAGQGISDDAASLGVFIAFGNGELFVEPLSCNIDALASFVDQQVVSRHLLLPWDFGHALSDRIVALFGGHRPRLTVEDTRELLAGAPQGVWQMGHLLSGPYGLLRSRELRRLPPSLSAGAVPCSDPGCASLHFVQFPDVTSPVHSAGATISGMTHGEHGPWYRVFDLLTGGRERYVDDWNTAELPVTLANGFAPGELRAVLATLITRWPDAIRPVAAEHGRLQTVFRASGERIAAELDEAETLQLLLLATDADVVRALDRAIEEGTVIIPGREVRTAVMALGRLDRGLWEVRCEVSSYGVRFRPTHREVSLTRLGRLLEGVYTDPRELADLHWKLQMLTVEKSPDSLDTYLRGESPRAALESLVFQRRETLERAFQHLRLGYFEIPSDAEGVEKAKRRILWKLGFDVPSFPALLPRFWELIDRHRDVLDQHRAPYDQPAREAIRGVAVNLFVALEEVLDLTLSFVTWALLYDHYGSPRFERFLFELPTAREFMAKTLNGRKLGEGVLEVRADQRNTLFPLVEGLGVLARACREHLSLDANELRRPQEHHPFWAGRTDLRMFPFVHTLPLLDLAAEAREDLLSLIESIPREFGAASVLDVRNRLEHSRDPFPTAEEISVALDCVANSITRLESVGVCPTVFLFRDRRQDTAGRDETVLVNYRGTTSSLVSPSILDGVSLPSSTVDQVIIPAARIGGTAESLRFRYSEPSPFVSMWRGTARPIGAGSRETTALEALEAVSGGASGVVTEATDTTA